MPLPVHNVQAEFQGGYTDRREQTIYLAVHHAAALYPTASGIEDVRAVARYHTQTQGWPGIGYHIALAEETNGGRIARYNLSDLDLVRAHVAWKNGVAVGVACLTNFVGIPDDKWIDALAEVLRELKQRYPGAIVVGHKEIALSAANSPDGKDWRTACPGPRWNDWKPVLLSRIDRQVDPFREWGPIDRPEGAAQGFAIPQAWLRNKATLGACVRGERYDLPGKVSRAIFRGGEVRYFAPLNVVEVLPYPNGAKL